MIFLKATPRGILVRLHIQPNARRSEVVGLHGDALKIRIQSPPVDGEANEELLRFLGELTGLSVELRSGSTSRHKAVEIHGWTLAEAEAFFRGLLIKST